MDVIKLAPPPSDSVYPYMMKAVTQASSGSVGVFKDKYGNKLIVMPKVELDVLLLNNSDMRHSLTHKAPVQSPVIVKEEIQWTSRQLLKRFIVSLIS